VRVYTHIYTCLFITHTHTHTHTKQNKTHAYIQTPDEVAAEETLDIFKKELPLYSRLYSIL
jgi:hypothetical protein